MSQKTKDKLNEIIFGADTPAGKAFDVGLIVFVILSVLAVVLESVEELRNSYSEVFLFCEYLFTGLFTIELILRLYCARSASRYLFSFFGIVDLLSILPLYLTWFFPFMSNFGIIRIFRVLRVFRILKLQRYINAGNTLTDALYESRFKIIVFLGFTLTTVTIIGTFMYIVEGDQNGFTSIPKGIYWAIVTITTVGYGDIVPQTIIGKFLSSVLMVLGYGVLAIPTGLVSAEIVHQKLKKERRAKACPKCGKSHHDMKAGYCDRCGTAL